MKYLTYFILSLFLSINLCNAQKPEVVHSIIKEDKHHSFFVTQAELWWKEIEKNEKNEKAWYYYYKANRYAKMTYYQYDAPDKDTYDSWLDESEFLKERDEITRLIEENIPNTFTYYIVTTDASTNDNKKFEYIQKAYDLEPDNPDTYDEFIVYYEVGGVLDKRKEYNKLWYKSNDISSGVLNYNYNVLMSMKEGAAILTFGDNDTFPLWMLQDVLGIRPDVTVLNISLLNMHGFQLGLINYARDIGGLQIGLLNTAQVMYGVQIGLINVISDKENLPVLPFINAAF